MLDDLAVGSTIICFAKVCKSTVSLIFPGWKLVLSQLSILRRRNADLSLESLAKGYFRLIAEQLSNGFHSDLVLKQASCPEHPPAGEICQRWLAHQFGETGGEGGTGKRRRIG